MLIIILSGLISIIGTITSVIVIKNGYITLGVMILILSVILLILSIYAIYIKYITKIKELENRVYLYEGVINELKNEITELKKGNKG